MKSLLLSLVLTVALAASLIVLHDRFRMGGETPLGRIEKRLDRIEERLRALTEEATPGPDAEPPPSLLTLQKRLAERMSDLEGMVYDAERNLRNDLKNMFEKLLMRMEQMQARSAGENGSGPPSAEMLSKLADQGVHVSVEEGMVELRGAVGQPSHPLELFAIAPGGRAHETLLVVELTPSALKSGLEALGLKPAGAPDRETGRWPEDASRVYIYVMWEGLKKPRRAEDMVLNTRTRDTMQRTPWIFTGSRYHTDTRTWERYFAADLHKNVIAITRNYSLDCILACPLEEAVDENIWAPDDVGCPAPGTKVRVLICREKRPAWDAI